MKKVFLTIDVEQDCPPFFDSTNGMKYGLPKLLDLFLEENITATFFSTGKMAEQFPDMMRRIVNEGHELGCHGYTHKRFDQMCVEEARCEIETASDILREYGKVSSFRAPNLNFPDGYLSILKNNDFTIDSSLAWYKWSHRSKIKNKSDFQRVPVSILCHWFRLPIFLSLPSMARFRSLVLNMHPWEFIDMTKAKIPFDCRYHTGDYAYDGLKKWIAFFKSKKYEFLTISNYIYA